MLRILLISSLFCVACERNLRHERYIENLSAADTLTVINPDFDTVFTIMPSQSAMIYSYKVLDTKQEREECKWLGDSLYIRNQLDSFCTKSVFIEENWVSKVEGPEKERVQTCIFSVDEDDF